MAYGATDTRIRSVLRAGLHACAAAVLALAVVACQSAPTQEFRAYADAAEALNQTTLKLIADYEASRNRPVAPAAGTDPVPTDFSPSRQDSTAAGVAERRAAVAALREYNRTMLTLAEGGGMAAVKGRVGQLVGLLGLAFPAAGQAASLLPDLAGRLEQARSAEEFRRALAEVTVPQADGKPCGTAAAPAAAPAATAPVPVAAASETLPAPAEAVGCVALIDALFALMKADTGTYYKAQYGLYRRARGALVTEFGDASRALYRYAARFERPTGGTALARLVAVELALNRASKAMLGGGHVDLTLGTAGAAPMDDATLATLERQVVLLGPFEARLTTLQAAAIAYHKALDAYVVEVGRTRNYLKQVEEAAARPADNVARVEEFARLGVAIESGAVQAREAFGQASVILLGTN